MRLFWAMGLCLWATVPASAKPGKDGSKTLLFLRNHISVESGFTFLRIKPVSETGMGNMQLSYRPGMYLGAKYHLNLNDYCSLRFGQILGLHAFRFDFDPGTLDTLSFSPVKMAVVKPYLSVPIEVNVRFRLQQRHVLGVVGGISLNLMAAEKIVANTSLSGNAQGEERYRMALHYQRPNPFVNIEAGLEYHFVLRSMDMVRFALKYSVGLRPIFVANYEHRENDFVLSSGGFNSYGDHLSVGVGYVFTRVNRLSYK